MAERAYYARELVTFVKYDANRSKCGQYIFIGYLNHGKTKFKDICSGQIYDLGVYMLEGEAERTNLVMHIDGQPFVQTGMSVQKGDASSFEFIWFSTKNIFSKLTHQPFIVHKLHPRYKSFYDYIEKQQNSALGVVTTTNIHEAVEEVNLYANNLVQTHKLVKQGARPQVVEPQIGLTADERDF